jgi:hypothetical protein
VGLFIGIVTCSHYNIRNAPVQLPQSVTIQSQSHYSLLEFTIICAPDEFAAQETS